MIVLIAGFIKDLTDSFAICQIVLIILNSMFIIPWGLEYLGIINQNKPTLAELEEAADATPKIDKSGGINNVTEERENSLTEIKLL